MLKTTLNTGGFRKPGVDFSDRRNGEGTEKPTNGNGNGKTNGNGNTKTPPAKRNGGYMNTLFICDGCGYAIYSRADAKETVCVRSKKISGLRPALPPGARAGFVQHFAVRR